ncbi:MAG: hypothetical protein H7A23_10650 [Leptospiraceae bacterium]|nr:hypothetical protein [Leptospiraceae bacterium]MCP5495004.1 hypothetical protein [Leptospiraceae bacterium]
MKREVFKLQQITKRDSNIFESEEEVEVYHNQRNLALSTIDELTYLKIDLNDAGVPVPMFINNAIYYLKKKYIIEDQSIGQWLRK